MRMARNNTAIVKKAATGRSTHTSTKRSVGKFAGDHTKKGVASKAAGKTVVQRDAEEDADLADGTIGVLSDRSDDLDTLRAKVAAREAGEIENILLGMPTAAIRSPNVSPVYPDRQMTRSLTLSDLRIACSL